MDQQAKQKIIIAGAVVALGLVILALIFSLFFSSKKQPSTSTQTGRSIDTVEFTSPLSEGNDNFTANYSGEVQPNKDPAVQTFKVFNSAGLSLPPTIASDLNSILIDKLQQLVPPTYATTFIHVDKKSIKCQAKNTDCSFGIYIDSPESYFKVRIIDGDGIAPSVTVDRQAWKGINQ